MLPGGPALATTCNPPLIVLKPQPERAVSLRDLSAAAAAGRQPRMGLTRLDGYASDPDNRDIILWGLAERNQPEIQFADFVVALRAAFGRYYEQRGGVTYRTVPLISIDPDPTVMRDLNTSDLSNQGGRDRYMRICKAPQTVRVEGMARHTRAAKVLVDADYRMKLVAQGSVQLPISKPFKSSFQAGIDLRIQAFMAGRSTSSDSTRYWFEPGRFDYQGAAEIDIALLEGDTVFMETAQVLLHDEHQVYGAQGPAVASGQVNPITRDFTCAWSTRMEEIYRAEPIWRDMHNIFRHFALTRIMFERNAFKRVGLSPDVLLDRYTLPHTPLPDTLPGAGRIVQTPVRGKDGAQTTLIDAVCGGVALSFDRALSNTGAARQAVEIGRQILASRPRRGAGDWSI